MRASRDAAEQCFKALSRKHFAEWVMDADITGCFDNINHDWLLNNVPMGQSDTKEVVEIWFQMEWTVVCDGSRDTARRIISPTLTNMALDGMEILLTERYGVKGSHKSRKNKVNLIRAMRMTSARTGTTKEVLEEARELIVEFLKGRGLTLSEEKTKIVHIEEALHFLGWNVRKYDGKLLLNLRKRTCNVLAESPAIIKESKTMKQENLVRKLNPIIRGWANYHQNQVAKETFSKVYNVIWKQLWQWACRRHPNKSVAWVKSKYFMRDGLRNGVFGTKVEDDKGEKKVVKLVLASDTSIKRHVKIKGAANPYDPEFETYFEERLGLTMKESFRGKQQVAVPVVCTGWVMSKCGEKITKETGWNLHHILPKAQGGEDKMTNLELLHPNCHRQVHSRERSQLPALVKQGFEEA